MDVNLKGAWRTLEAVVRHMVERRAGSIVLTASANGRIGNAARRSTWRPSTASWA